MRELKAYYVCWIDSASYAANEWSSAEDLMKLNPIVCHSVGFLLKNEPEYITIIAHVHEDEGGGEQTIPRECIKTIVEITVPNEVHFDG